VISQVRPPVGLERPGGRRRPVPGPPLQRVPRRRSPGAEGPPDPDRDPASARTSARPAWSPNHDLSVEVEFRSGDGFQTVRVIGGNAVQHALDIAGCGVVGDVAEFFAAVFSQIDTTMASIWSGLVPGGTLPCP
jgi:hypothetical protein